MLFWIVFISSVVFAYIMGLIFGYHLRRNFVEGTHSASHNRQIMPCDKCGPRGVIDQYHWNYCSKCGRELHTA